jgi:GxxExxY protein
MNPSHPTTGSVRSERPVLNVALHDITDRIIGCCFKVHRALGSGFLEMIYDNALMIELETCGLRARQQAPVVVKYDGRILGEYFADILVEDQVLCELKAVEVLSKQHEVQLVHYLTATGIEIGLLINFGRSVTVRRKYRKYRPTNDMHSE